MNDVVKIIFLCIVVSMVSPFSQAQPRNQPELLKPQEKGFADFGVDTKNVVMPKPADDQRNTQIIQNLLKRTDWFPNVKATVSGGIVEFHGEITDKKKLDWLVETVDRLPTVIAVINRTELLQPRVTDLSPAVDELRSTVDKTKRLLPRIAIGIVLLIGLGFLGYLLNKTFRTLWSRRIQNPFLLNNITRLTMLPIWVMFVFLVFKTIGLSGLAATIIGGTGVLGIVLGFAFKGIAENYLSGVLLAMRTPFTRGDQIKVANYEGIVQSLSMRGTTIVDFNGNHILIPNSIIVTSVVENRTANPLWRIQFSIILGAGASFVKARETVLKVLASIKEVLEKPAPFINIENVEPLNTKLRVYFWFNMKETDGFALRFKVIDHVREALIKGGIKVPDDAREIMIHDSSKVQKMESAKSHVRKSQFVDEHPPTQETNREDLLQTADQSPLHQPEENLLK